MINLLNPAELKQIRAARFNIRLRRYLVMTVLTIVVVAATYGVGYKFAKDEHSVAESRNQAAQKDLAAYSDVKDKSKTFRSNLEVAKKILSSEIVFSEFMTDVAKTLPPNTVLSDLTLTTKQTTSGTKKKGSTQLQARAKSYNDVLAIKGAFEQSPLFSDVSIASTSMASGNSLVGVEAAYPYEVTLNLVINELGVGK